MLDYSPTTNPVPSPAMPMQAVIDQLLQLLASDCHRLGGRLGTSALPAISLPQLRAGPLGQELACLAEAADGRMQMPPAKVAAAIEDVLRLLFWPTGADDFVVPRTFWETGLGRLLARAKFRAFAAADLVGINDAAEQLGVSRPTIYRWMDGRSLDYVHDELSGRMFVVRQGVDLRRQVAIELLA